MKAKQAHDMTTDELTARLGELKKELFSLRFSHATDNLPNANLLVTCRRDIARVKTVLREREIAGGKK
ncbi:MAG: 50S ribosomal protein L29 [Clostridiales bacterium]|jgi:large subunit ribosomal protein L29|nr:50S ribosomal protein L29 [Clostridiales bacterium]